MNRKTIGLNVVLLIVTMITASFYGMPLTVSQAPEYGPKLEHLRLTTVTSPDAQVLFMEQGLGDMLPDMIRPGDIERLSGSPAFLNIYAAPGDHFCYFAFNMRFWFFGPQDGSDGPGRALRHAIAHMTPKSELIGSLFRYIVTEIEAPAPPAQGEWYENNVDPHPYDMHMAAEIMEEGGWEWTGSAWQVNKPGHPDHGKTLPAFTFYSPTYEVAPTSHDIVAETVTRMQSLTLKGPDGVWDTADDIPAGLPVTHQPFEFLPLLVKILTYPQDDWEMYFLCYGSLGRYATFLYGIFNSVNDIDWGDNTPGLHNNDIDTYTSIIMTSLVHADKIAAAHNVHKLLMGTTGYTYKNTTDGIIARIPIYSRTYYTGHDPDMAGIVNGLLTGTDNSWTFVNAYWTANPRISDMVQNGEMMVYVNGEEMERLNPTYATGAYTWNGLDRVYDGLLSVNPYDLTDIAWFLNATKDPDYPNTPGYYIEPWTVTDGPAAGASGMKVTFYLIDDGPVMHDGHVFDAHDAAFAWEYLSLNVIANFWSTFRYFHHAEVIGSDNRTVAAYMTQTSQFTPLGLAGDAMLTPEHIWGCSFERGGRAVSNGAKCTNTNRYDAWNNADKTRNAANGGTAGSKGATDADVAMESGLCTCVGTTMVGSTKTTCSVTSCGCVLDDPTTGGNEILSYDPMEYSWATTAYPWLKELVSTGPWIFYNYDSSAQIADLIAFDLRTQGGDPGTGTAGNNPGVEPNTHYYYTTAEFDDIKAKMFHIAGDVNSGGTIDVFDLRRQGIAYGLIESLDSAYDADADLTAWDLWLGYTSRPGFNIIDMMDIAKTTKNWGKMRTYP